MANIEELDFTVILDDQDFNAKVQKDIKLAKDLNVSLSTLLEAKRKVNSIDKETVVNNRRALQMETDLVRATELRNREKVRTEGLQRRINAQIEAANQGYKTQGKILNELKGLAATYLSVQGAQKVLSSLVRVTGEFEMQRTTLRAMLGDLDQADRIISQMKELAVVSPFEFKDLTTYAKQLAAYSVPVNEIYDTTKMLADVSSGLGVDMDRLILAYGQVRSAAFLRGQEVRQFTEAGIPILDELAKQFSELEGRAVSAGEVFDKISARLVPFEMVEKVFKNLTSEGGKFYKMQEVQAGTLQGKLSNLKDAYEIMLSEIGEANIDRMKGAVDWARRLMENYEDTGKTIKALVIAFGSYKVALGIITVATKGLKSENLKLIKGLRNIVTFAAANPYIALAVGVGVLAGVIYKAATAQSTYEKMADASNKAVSEYNKNTESEISLMNYLLGRMGKLKQGTSEYNDVKSELLRNYGQYLSDVDKEKIAIGDLAGIYDKLSQSIRTSARERALRKGNDEITEAYNQEYEKIFKNVDRLTKKVGIYENKGIRQELADYVRGIIELKDLSEEAKEARNKEYNPIIDLNYFDQQRERLKMLEEETARQRDQLSTNLEFTFGVEPKPKIPEEDQTKFVETVRKTLETKFGVTKDKKGIAAALWVEPTTEYYGYLEDIRKAYNGINQKIKDTGTTQKDNVKNLKKQKEMIEEIAKALGISLKEEDYKNYKHKPKSQEQKSIESEIASLRKLQDLYEKFKKYNVYDADISKLFLGYFPDLTEKYGEDFITKLDFLNRAVELTRELAKYDPEGAQRILTSLGVSASDEDLKKLEEAEKKYKKASAAAKELYESMRKWSTEDYNIEGTGIAHDISKINTDLSTTFNEIDLKAQKLKETLSQINTGDEAAIAKVKETFIAEFGEHAWQPFWDSYVKGGKDAINKFVAAEKEYEKKLAQEKINDLAKKYVTEMTENLNMTDWSDKSLGQIIQIKNELASLLSADIPISEELKSALIELGVTTDDLQNKIKILLGKKYKNVLEEQIKKTIKIAKEATSIASQFGEQFEKLGDATDNEELKTLGSITQELSKITGIITECESLMAGVANSSDDVGEGMGNISDNAQEAGAEVKNIAKSSSWITMLIKLVLMAITKIVDGISQSRQAIIEAERAAVEYANALQEIEFNRAMDSHTNIFGTDILNKFKEANKLAKDYKATISQISGEIGTTSNEQYKFTEGMSGWATFSKKAHEAVKSVESMGKGDILVDMRSKWQKFWGTGNDLVKSFSIEDFFDENGNLKLDELKAAYENYGEHMSEENKLLIEDLIAQGELYVKATEEMDAYLKSLFSDLAADIASNMIDSFVEIGDACANLEDVFENLGESILHSFLQSYILEKFLNKYEGQVNDLMEKVADGEITEEEFAERLGRIADSIKVGLEHDASYIEGLIKAFQDNGLLHKPGEDGDSMSLGNGIKSITEDTANLLASYLNAIRADVSFGKLQWMQMNVSLKQILGLLPQSPTLADYLAQIQANTFNTAENTARILRSIDSVTTSEGGYRAIRVYS